MEDPVFGNASDYNKTSLPQYLARRIGWALGNKSPLVAYLKLTKRCNLDCYYCPWHTGASDFSEELDTQAWKDRLGEVYNRGVRLVVFEGGEPTLRRDLPVLIAHARKLGLHVVLATNGLGDPWRFQPTVFTVSLDGPREYHDSVRGAGTYDRIITNLSRKGDHRVVVITVLTRHNLQCLEELLEELTPLVDGFLLTFLYPYKASRLAAIPPQEIAAAKRMILELKRRYLILNPKSRLKRPTNSLPCHHSLSMSIDHRGNFSEGCFVDHVEERDCESCELACYQLLSSFSEFNLEAWFHLYRLMLRAI